MTDTGKKHRACQTLERNTEYGRHWKGTQCMTDTVKEHSVHMTDTGKKHRVCQTLESNTVYDRHWKETHSMSDTGKEHSV